MNKLSKYLVALVAVIAVFGLVGCSSTEVQAGRTGVLVDDYAIIPTDPVVFGCQQPETSEFYWNVRNFEYPTRQISFDASGGDGSERQPYKVVSNAKSPAELNVPVTVTFDLTDDCDKLKDFHRNFGTKYLPTDEDHVVVADNAGWVNLLNYVIGQPLEQTLIRVSQKYTWQQIWNDEAVRAEYVNALQNELPKEAQGRTNGVDYFSGFRITVGKPTPTDDGLKNALIAEQKAIADARATEAKGVADANARKATAEADITAAQAETEVARQQALTRAAGIAGYPDTETYLKAKAIEAGINPWPSPIVAGVGR